jgi:hypothetical protein
VRGIQCWRLIIICSFLTLFYIIVVVVDRGLAI